MGFLSYFLSRCKVVIRDCVCVCPVRVGLAGDVLRVELLQVHCGRSIGGRWTGEAARRRLARTSSERGNLPQIAVKGNRRRNEGPAGGLCAMQGALVFQAGRFGAEESQSRRGAHERWRGRERRAFPKQRRRRWFCSQRGSKAARDCGTTF
ncbi:hypothetical protein BKA81DRAFT_363649 [Phyllosticta paracitricarpa]